MTIWRLVLTFALAIVLGLACPVSPARAATLTVDTQVDDPSLATCDATAPGDCSLRGAIIAAAGLPGPGAIQVPAGTYILTRSTSCSFRVSPARGRTSCPLSSSGPSACRATSPSSRCLTARPGRSSMPIEPAGNNDAPAPVAFVSSLATVEVPRPDPEAGPLLLWWRCCSAPAAASEKSGALRLVDSVVGGQFLDWTRRWHLQHGRSCTHRAAQQCGPQNATMPGRRPGGSGHRRGRHRGDGRQSPERERRRVLAAVSRTPPAR